MYKLWGGLVDELKKKKHKEGVVKKRRSGNNFECVEEPINTVIFGMCWIIWFCGMLRIVNREGGLQVQTF